MQKNGSITKIISIFSAITTEILRSFFTGLGGKKKNPRIHMEPQRLQNAKAVLRRKNCDAEVPDCKLHSRTTVRESAWH